MVAAQQPTESFGLNDVAGDGAVGRRGRDEIVAESLMGVVSEESADAIRPSWTDMDSAGYDRSRLFHERGGPVNYSMILDWSFTGFRRLGAVAAQVLQTSQTSIRTLMASAEAGAR